MPYPKAKPPPMRSGFNIVDMTGHDGGGWQSLPLFFVACLSLEPTKKAQFGLDDIKSEGARNPVFLRFIRCCSTIIEGYFLLWKNERAHLCVSSHRILPPAAPLMGRLFGLLNITLSPPFVKPPAFFRQSSYYYFPYSGIAHCHQCLLKLTKLLKAYFNCLDKFLMSHPEFVRCYTIVISMRNSGFKCGLVSVDISS